MNTLSKSKYILYPISIVFVRAIWCSTTKKPEDTGRRKRKEKESSVEIWFRMQFSTLRTKQQAASNSCSGSFIQNPSPAEPSAATSICSKIILPRVSLSETAHELMSENTMIFEFVSVLFGRIRQKWYRFRWNYADLSHDDPKRAAVVKEHLNPNKLTCPRR